MAPDCELWIVGAGPAALLLAQACIERGVRVGLIAPEPREPWPPNYGIWTDDASTLGVEAYLEHRWSQVEARFTAGPRLLDRGYGLLDDRRLQLDILRDCAGAGASIVADTVSAIEHDDDGVTLVCESGERRRGRLVVDASGHGSPWVEREAGPGPGYQVAWGELCRIADPIDLERMTFMDWSSSGPEERDEELPPTFLYAMPMAADLLFVEETVLTARLPGGPASLLAPLERRLHRRLDRMGVRRVGSPIEVERCVIPMGGPLPRRDQRTLGFGGAAGMVHPATGYMVTNVLRRRHRVAAEIAAQLEGWVGPGRPSSAIWGAIWPAAELRAWRLYGFGMEVLAGLDRSQLEDFFAEFFELPAPRWRGFVSASAGPSELMTTMLRYFARAPGPIRRRLAGALWSAEGRRMTRGLVRPGP